MIRCDERNPTAVAMRDALLERIDEHTGGSDFVIVIGGDGFLLRTIAELGTEPTYFGLNAGHLGFLLNDVIDWKDLAGHLVDQRVTRAAFPLLHATVETSSGQTLIDRGLNDVYLERASGQTARLAISVDGQIIVDPLVADGVIFATALGSTAYSFSAGGMACHPSLSILTVTPIAPHHPRLHPFALPPEARASVRIVDGDRRPVRVVVDGRTTENVAQVDIEYGSDKVTLAYLPERDFTTRMIRKILRP